MFAPPPEEASEIHRWASSAWSGMAAAGVLPTPENFGLWFSHASGANPELSRQVMTLLDKQAVMEPSAWDVLRANFPDPKVPLDEVIDQAEGLDQAAQGMIDDVASNGQHLRQYGDTLSHWSTKLTQDRTLDSLVEAVTTLATETARASERNRALEQQLSTSSARITRLKDCMAGLKRGATTDVLTGLFNRKTFDMRLRRALSEAKADASPVCVLMLDVDHFKRVNDTYGHHTGDLVLRLIGRLLAESVKGRDTSARYGGEEFAVILVGADLKAGASVANQIRLTLENKHLVKKRSTDEFGVVTVSVGVAQFRANETPAALLKRADAAMYQAKQLGRNQVCVSQDISDRQWTRSDRLFARD